jgi:hypothetical protein
MIRMRGEDTENALRDWAKKDLVDSSTQIYELGRFLFSVSSGTAALFLTLKKISTQSSLNCCLIISMLFFLLTIILALYLAIPKLWKISGETDLLSVQRTRVLWAVNKVYIWLIIWVLGLIFGVLSIW